MEAYGEWRYGAASSLPRHIIEVSDHISFLTALRPGETTPVLFELETGCVPQSIGTLWGRENALLLPGIER